MTKSTGNPKGRPPLSGRFVKVRLPEEAIEKIDAIAADRSEDRGAYIRRLVLGSIPA